MDPLPEDHDFFDELCELIERHESEELSRQKLFFACVSFGHDWLETFYMTGSTW